MTARTFIGLFVAEGSSDLPLSDIVERMFFDKDLSVQIRRPDFGLLPGVAKDVRSRLEAGCELAGDDVDFFVVHRDADNAGSQARRTEILAAARLIRDATPVVPVIPIRMTEAWLLLDEVDIRTVAGNPRGRAPLELPKLHEVEQVADPKSLLSECLLRAADVTGRRRERLATRFPQHRRQLLERLDTAGRVTELSSWKQLTADIDALVEIFRSEVRLDG
jgi:hypothetical protein